MDEGGIAGDIGSELSGAWNFLKGQGQNVAQNPSLMAALPMGSLASAEGNKVLGREKPAPIVPDTDEEKRQYEPENGNPNGGLDH